MTTIIGAGLAGLLAGNVFRDARIVEAGSAEQATHKAVLRFRSNAVGAACGIDFRKVQVNKGLWSNGKFVKPNIQLANLYSQKVIDRLADRSIWKMDPVERFVAPENLIEQMAERCAGRIQWNTRVDSTMLSDFQAEGPIISTMPMNRMADLVVEPTAAGFSYAPIKVRRWHIPGADVFQTIYFPDPETNLYRASITGNLLIAEYRDEEDGYDLFTPFGITEAQCVEHDSVKQSYGKIAPIDERWRRSFILDLTQNHGIYSVGRFATWRNLILDDALNDIYVVKSLMDGDGYSQRKHAFAK